MKLKKNIAISESGFVFNPSTGDSYSANPVAVKILELLKEGLSDAEIKKTLQLTYDVTNIKLEEDFFDFVSHLKQLNLVDNE
jgi:hypothetical protein